MKSKGNFLVVDGFLNATDGTITVNLSRSVPLSDSGTPPREIAADIALEDSDGISVVLSELEAGLYSYSGLTIDYTKKYRLNIKTLDTREYLSDFVEIKPSPAIDTVGWKPTASGVTIYLNTHDDTDRTRYYQWISEETYRYTSVFYSTYKYENGEVSFRPSSESYYECFKTDISPSILIGTSRQLEHDIIHEFPVAIIPKGSKKLYSRYSILVKQRAITKEAYEFYDKLKKTTEELGGLFDPQPGQVTGNIHSTDPNEVVLGFFSGGSEQEKRIFIKLLDLPPNLRDYPGTGLCKQDSLPIELLNGFDPFHYDLVDGIYEMITLVGYTYAPKTCTDCRLQGGTIEKPEFW